MFKKLIYLIFPILLLGLVGCISEESLEFVSFTLYGAGGYYDVDADENYFYICDNSLVTFDISNPENPVEINAWRPLERGDPRETVVHGNYAYANWTHPIGEIRVLDISNKTNPIIVSQGCDQGYEHVNLCLIYPYLYTLARVPLEKYHLRIIDVCNPFNPFPTGSFDLEYLPDHVTLEHFPGKFIVDGDYLYFTFGPRGQVGTVKLHVFDVSDPTSDPKPIGCLNDVGSVDADPPDMWSGPNMALAKRGNYVYMTGPFINSPECDIKIINVSTPTDPFVEGWWNGPIDIMDIDISGNYAYVTDHDKTLYVLDISDPLNPQQLGEVTMSGIPEYYPIGNFKVKVRNNYAYLGLWDFYAFYIVDITDPFSPEEVQKIESCHCNTDVSVCGSYVYVSVWDYLQFYTIDMNLQQSPVVVDRKEVLGSGWGIDIEGDYAYLAMGARTDPNRKSGGLTIFDITTDPSNPAYVGWCPPRDPDENNEDVHIDVDGNYAYIAVGEPTFLGIDRESDNPGLRIVDVSDPTNPTQVGTYDSVTQARSVHKVGDYAYLAAREGGLHIIDVTNPYEPTFVEKWDPGNNHALGVFVKDNYAYVAYGNSNSLCILDVNDPTDPEQVASYPVWGECREVVVKGNYAFVVGQNFLRVLDVSDPPNPSEVACQVNTFGLDPVRVDVDDDYCVYVNCLGGGIYTFKFKYSGFFTF